MTKWDDKSWQKDFLNVKSHSPADAKLLLGGEKGLKDAQRLDVLYVEYGRLKKLQEATIDSIKIRGSAHQLQKPASNSYLLEKSASNFGRNL